MKVQNKFTVVFPNFKKASTYQDLQDKVNKQIDPNSQSRIGILDRGRFFVTFLIKTDNATKQL